MILSEIFHSLQGEGWTAGIPAVFVRLGQCNLHCNFCDTEYTWKEGMTDYREIEHEKMIEQIKRLLEEHPRTRTIIWTGGEPMLQQQAIVDVINQLKTMIQDRTLRHEVETNGTVRPLPTFDELVEHYNCSPKTASSGNNPYTTVLKDNPKASFKFVVGTHEHCVEALAEIERQKLDRERCMLMVLGTTAEDMVARSPLIADFCATNGLRLCLRLQCIIWGRKRGV